MSDVIIIDSTSGDENRRPLTPDEESQRQAAVDAAAAEEQAEADAEAKRQADEQAWRDAIAAASTLAALKDALLGTGLPAQAEARPKSNA